jgi:hypothetical protein
VRGRVERVLCFSNPMRRDIFRGDGRVHLLMPLIQELDGGEPLGHKGAGAVELLLRQLDLSLLLDKVRLCLVDGAIQISAMPVAF